MFWATGREIENAIIFWDTLYFQPNQTAVLYLYEKVYVPYLVNHGVAWYVAGQRSGIERLGRKYSNIKIMGLVDDLYWLASRVPDMINPMIMGSGLKNKVLEAFSFRCAVVSTAMGMEAIEATPGVHFVEANDPRSFGNAVLSLLGAKQLWEDLGENANRLVVGKYRWDGIGERLNSLVNGIART